MLGGRVSETLVIYHEPTFACRIWSNSCCRWGPWCLRAGMRADKRTKAYQAWSIHLVHRPIKVIKLATRKHKFFCLAYKDQEGFQPQILTRDLPELGEKEIEFPKLDVSAEELKEIFLHLPRLHQGGGYQLLKCMPNTYKFEPLSSGVYSSPAALKQCVGSSRTYLRPIQHDLDLEPAEDADDSGVSVILLCTTKIFAREKCCQAHLPLYYRSFS